MLLPFDNPKVMIITNPLPAVHRNHFQCAVCSLSKDFYLINEWSVLY